ncbi:MAG: hypothetical protein J6B50_11355 [Lachnospiraceae bacterium]|nr:hypothetical protein [Lachnospiraceae bacterium]MBP3595248.1 hypothetical protein [Lachnospiraceae bacterium]
MDILIWTMGGHDIGMGHIFRQINLFHKLSKIYQVCFAINDDLETKELLKFNEIPYVVYNEFNDVLAYLKNNKPKLLVIDRLDTDSKEIVIIKKYIDTVISFDDRGSGVSNVDVVINAIVPSLPETKKLLKGHEYMIFTKNVENRAKMKKLINDRIEKVLVTFGGSDPKEYTLKLEFLFSKYPSVQFFVVIGPNYQNKEKIKSFGQMYKNVQVLENCNDLSEYLYSADIALISGGITLFEAAYIGTPCIVLCQVEHQNITAKKFFDEGACEFINCAETELEEAVVKLFNKIKKQEVRLQMSNLQKKYVSVNGIENVLNVIKQLL